MRNDRHYGGPIARSEYHPHAEIARIFGPRSGLTSKLKTHLNSMERQIKAIRFYQPKMGKEDFSRSTKTIKFLTEQLEILAPIYKSALKSRMDKGDLRIFCEYNFAKNRESFRGVYNSGALFFLDCVKSTGGSNDK